MHLIRASLIIPLNICTKMGLLLFKHQDGVCLLQYGEDSIAYEGNTKRY